MKKWTAPMFGAAAALFLATAPAASAATWCVKDPACPAGGNSSQSTISGAVAAAAAGDTILVGPGRYSESVSADLKPLNIIGAGPSRTIVQSPTPAGTTMISAGNVANIGIELGGTGGTGLAFNSSNGSATDVAVTAPAGITSGTGVAISAGVFDHGTVTLPIGPGIDTIGVGPQHFNGTAAVQDSTITAETGLLNIPNIARDRISGVVGVKDGNGTPGGGVDEAITIDDTLIATASAAPGPETGIEFDSASEDNGDFVSTTLTLRHCTLVGSGSPGSIGVATTTTAGTGNVDATTDMTSTIVRGYLTSLSTAPSITTGHSTTDDIDDDYSDFDPALESESKSFGAIEDSINDGVHDVDVNPGFINAVGNPDGYHLLATSPLIDAGEPALEAGESPTDLDGDPRFVAAHGNPVPISDIGAFEYQPHAPSVTVHAAPTTVARGHAASFSADGSAPNPGDQLAYSWRFGDGASASGPSVSHAFMTPGTHTATVTVTDLDKLTATAIAHVVVIGPGHISKLQIKPSSLRHGGRAVVTYRDSEPATTTFSIQRQTGHRRFKTVATVRHADLAGANRFTLTAARLKPGRYRLVAVARDIAGAGPASVVSFTIRR